jgi:hypothetical protein
MTKSYRATIVRGDGKEEDWGFYDLRVDAGTLFLRVSEQWPPGTFDVFLAASEWREVRDMFVEEEL